MYANKRLINDIIKLCNEMKQNNIPISTHIFTTLINICGNKGWIDDAIKIFNEMKQNNIPINTVTYNTLINMHGNKGLIDDSNKQTLQSNETK